MFSLSRMTRFLEEAIEKPHDRLSRSARMVAKPFKFAYYVWMQLVRDRCLQQASALSFKTIFGLIPVAFIVLMVLRSVGGFAHIDKAVENYLYRQLNIDSIQLATDSSGKKISLADEIRKIIDRLNQQIDVRSISIIGLIMLILAAISVLSTVEEAFNTIWKVPRGRSPTRRIVVYWAGLTLGPLFVAASVYLTGKVAATMGNSAVHVPFARGMNFLAAFSSSFAALLLLYVLLPNTSVSWRAACIGALVAAAFWEIAKYGFSIYVTKAIMYSKIYGSLGLLPLFFLWVYLSWVIVLFGAELAYTYEHMPELRYRLGQAWGTGCVARPDLVGLAVMNYLAQRFAKGKGPAGLTEIARAVKIEQDLVDRVLRVLAERGFVVRAENERYMLGMAPDAIPLRAVCRELQRKLMSHPALLTDGLRRLADRLTSSEFSVLSSVTLADVANESRKRREQS